MSNGFLVMDRDRAVQCGQQPDSWVGHIKIKCLILHSTLSIHVRILEILLDKNLELNQKWLLCDDSTVLSFTRILVNLLFRKYYVSLTI